MKAYTLTSYRNGGELAWADIPRPSVNKGQVLVKVSAAGINPLDRMIARGDFKQLISYRLPQTLGHECSGEIVEVGADVHNLHVGDKIYARPSTTEIGTFAEYVVLNANDVAPMPKNLSLTEAASLPLVLLTAIQAFTEKAPIRPGNTVFIQGGAGGLGSIAIQVAKHLGATVATTVSTKNIELARELGADIVVDYRTERYEDYIHNVDIVLDTVGGDETARSMRVLRPGGTIVSVVGAPDTDFADALGKPILKPVMWLLSAKIRRVAKRLGVTYKFLFMRANGKQLRDFTPVIESGKIKPLVGRVLPFNQVEEALHPSAANSGSPGKTVIEMSN